MLVSGQWFDRKWANDSCFYSINDTKIVDNNDNKTDDVNNGLEYDENGYILRNSSLNEKAG